MKKFQSSLSTKRVRLSRREIIRKGGALTALLMTGCDSQFYKPPVLKGWFDGNSRHFNHGHSTQFNVK